VNIAVQGVAATTKGTGIVYEFSKDALDLCQQGKARIAIHSSTGKYLPYTGKMDELWNNSLPRDSAQWVQLEAAAKDAAARLRRAEPKSDFADITARISQHAGLIGGLGAHSANLVASI